MRLPRIPLELVLILVVLIAIAVATQAASPEQTASSPPDLVSDSDEPNGASALYLWLDSLGYQVARLEYRAFRPDDSMKVLFVLAPYSSPDASELSALKSWVERGGTLVLAGNGWSPLISDLSTGAGVRRYNTLSSFLDKFGLKMESLGETQGEVKPSQPLLVCPTVEAAWLDAKSYISGGSGLVSYLGAPDQPVAAGLTVGKGTVYVLASTYALANQGIGQADNAALLLNWLPAPDKAGMVGFDEIHHDRADPESLGYLILHEPWGWALLYTLGIGFLYLALSGRRLGRAVPTIVDTRRLSAEYVVSVANLLRRAGKSDWVARHYERALRRQLLSTLGQAETEMDAPALASRLSSMGQIADGLNGREAGKTLLELHNGTDKDISEGRLVRLVNDVDRIIKACGGRRQ